MLGIISAAKDNEHLMYYYTNYEWSIKNKYCYTSLFPEYEFIFEYGPFENFSDAAQPQEVKPYVLKRYLSQYDWLIWMDVDSFFQNFGDPIDRIITGNSDIIVQDHKWVFSFASSTFFVKNSPNGHRFLDIWIDMLENHCGNHKWAWGDQNAWLEAIMVLMNEVRKNSSSAPYKNHCRVLGQCNTNASCYEPILSNLGYPYGSRNDPPNNIITFWNRHQRLHGQIKRNNPYRAFGFSREWYTKDSTCTESDIICHCKYNRPYYKELTKRFNLNSICPGISEVDIEYIIRKKLLRDNYTFSGWYSEERVDSGCGTDGPVCEGLQVGHIRGTIPRIELMS